MPSRRWIGGALALALVAGSALLSAPYAVLGTSPELPDPIPLLRVYLPPERLPEEMKRLGQGQLRQLPRDEFEGLVRRAARAGETAKKVPRLVEARYRARVAGGDLVGTGAWKVLNPAAGPAVLALTGLNLALRQPRFENRPALVGDLEGKGPALLLEEGGEHALALDWSARGERRPEGLTFALEVPASPVAELELQAPADQVVTVISDGCLLAGPRPAEMPDQRLWTVAFGGRSQVRLVLRQADAPGQPPPLLLAGLHTVQHVNPDAVLAAFAFTLTVLHPGVRELRCECDPALRPYEVRFGRHPEELRPLDTWQLVPGSGAAPPSLVIHPPEPFQGGTLEVLALAPLGAAGGAVPWASPGLRLEQAAPLGETLELRLHPDVAPERWQPGGFRLTASRTEADGTLVLDLAGGGLASGSGARRPAALLRTSGVEYRARQLTWWRLAPAPGGDVGAAFAGGSSLTVQLTYDVLRGHLFQLPVGLPPAWEVDRVQLHPADLLQNYAVRTEAGRPVLLVDLQRPVSPGPSRPEAARPGTLPAEAHAAGSLLLTVWLRPSPAAGPGADRLSYPFPDVVPCGARLREGGLAIDFDESAYEARPSTLVAAEAPGEAGPWGQQPPGLYYPYHGKVVRGTLTLVPRRPRVRARCSSAVGLTAERAAVETHMTLEPEVGKPEAVDLYLSAPPRGRWEWRTEEGVVRVRAFERLPAVEAAALLAPVGVPRPLETTGLVAALARPPAGLRGERWRLTFDQPLREPVSLAGTWELRRAAERPGGPAADVPLVSVPGAARMEGEVKLYLAGANRVRVETVGLRELQAPAGPRGNAPPPWRSFHYSQPPLALTVSGQGAAADLAPRPSLDHAQLTAYAGPDGALLLHYRFEARNWQQPTLPLRLPAGARLLRARVDGRWLPQLAAAAPPGWDAPSVGLPVPAGAAGHRFEVVYAVDRPAWQLWARLDVPEPGLPLELRPRWIRRTWRLAPGVAPLLSSQDQLPGPAAPPDTPTAWGQWADGVWQRWGPPAWLRLLALADGPAGDWQAEQRERLAQAAAAAAKPGSDRARSLGEALRRLVFDQAQDQEVLVLDAEALREAGLGPTTPLTAVPPAGAPERPFWEAVGLVLVPCPGAPLLTTRARAEAWRYAARQGSVPSASLAQAVAEAVLFGHDRSGRFALVMDWGSPPPDGTDFGTVALVPEPVGRGWTAWEPLAGTLDSDSLVVVRQDALPWWGGTLAALLGLAWWRARWWARSRRLALLLLWLAAAGLALLWLPAAVQALAWWPLMAGLAVAAVWYVQAAVRGLGSMEVGTRPGAEGSPPGTGGRSASSWTARPVSVLLLAGLSAGWYLLPGARFHAATPEPATVYLVPGPDGSLDRGSVLAPPELVTRLGALARRGAPGLRGAVLVSADYRGEVKAEDPSGAAFEAVLAVHCFGDEPTQVALPLGGVQIEELLVDGASAAPLPTAAPGCAAPVKGKGEHAVTLHFRVPVQASGADRDLQFTVPRLLQSRLALTVPAGARYLQAPVKQGATTADPRGNRIEVELGQVPAPVHVHWLQESGPLQAPAVKVEELYLWELGASASKLTALLRYTVARGAATGLDVDLPGQLAVRNVDVAAVGTEEPRPRLRDLYYVGPQGARAGEAWHRLRLDFQAPITTGVQVVLDLVPRRPLDPGEVLPLPAPLGAEPTSGYLAYRLDGLVGEPSTYLRVRPIEPADFARRWKEARGIAPAPLTYACVFGRKPASPALGLEVRVRRPHFEAIQDLAWRLGPQQADLRASLRLTAPEGDLGLVEWDVPEGVTLAAVTGPDVRGWSRSGSHVQVWLRRCVGTTELQLAGWWLPPAPQAARAAPGAGAAWTLELPRLGLPSAQALTTYVRLRAADGLAVTALRQHGLLPLPRPRPSEQDEEYVAPSGDYGGTFRVRPAPALADVQVLTLAELRDRQLVFTAWVDCRPRPGELRAVEVRLRNWDGDGATLRETPEVARARIRTGDGGERTWAVDFRPGVTGRCRLVLTGSLPLEDAAAGVPMPEVAVPGAARSERWLAVAGPGLTAQEPRGLAAVRDPAIVVRTWREAGPALRRPDGALWRVADDDWGLRLLPREQAAGPAPVRVFLTEQTARVADGRHWVHEATYWLDNEGASDLSVSLPAGAAVVGALVDGVEVTLLRPGPESASLWLPLPGGGGARRLCLRWTFPEGESLDRPNLERPRLRGARDGPVVWDVAVPAGYGAGVPAHEAARPASRAGVELRRAEAQLQLSAALAAKARGRGDASAAQLAAAQRRFFEAVRNAQHWLATDAARPALARSASLGGDADGALAAQAVVADSAPDGRGLAEWLQQMEEREAQVARTSPELEAVRAEARRQAWAGDDPGGRCDEAGLGTPLHLQTGDPTAPAPQVRLTAAGRRQAWQALGSSLLLAVFLLGAWALAAFPGVAPRPHGRWPEQAALLGGVAWLVFGFHLLGAFLLVLGVVGRLAYLVRQGWARLWRPAPQASGSGVGSA
jgi:hypothetical protein